jgi:hypothetical protein
MKNFITIAALFGFASAAQIYDQTFTDVVMYTNINFDKQVAQKREKGISIVHFYKSGGKYFQSFYHYIISSCQKTYQIYCEL